MFTQVADPQGVICSDVFDIANMFTQFYQYLLTSSQPTHIDLCISALYHVVTDKMNEFFC